MKRASLVISFALLLVAAATQVAPAQSRAAHHQATRRALAIRAELAGVLLQSQRYDDAAREFRTLLALDPGNRDYRLGLARSLAWGKRFSEAERELVVLEARDPGDPAVDALLTSVRLGLTPTSRQAATWLENRPGHIAYRRILARALTREGRTDEALAHYDTLIRARATPDHFVERANAHVERRDFKAAERDAYSSIASGPTHEAFLLLGDLHRWRGDLAAARAWYIRARVLRPESPEVSAAFGRLARDERPAVAFMPDVGEPVGWATTSTSMFDNLGVNLSALGLRRGVREHQEFDASVGMKVLRLSDRALGGGAAEAYAADLAISREITRKRFYARGRARAGFAYHPSADLVPEAVFTLAAFAGAWGVGAEISTSPAYPSLVTLASMQLLANGSQLREENSAISVAGPLGEADIAARHQSTSLSDGNTRTSLQGYVRFPAWPSVALVYAGSALSFAQTSALYWSPQSYVAHSAGLEYAVRRVQGLSFAARVLPGVAWARDDTAVADVSRKSAMQLAGGIEMSYRALDWEIGTALSYGRGRAGDYERVEALVRARYLP